MRWTPVKTVRVAAACLLGLACLVSGGAVASAAGLQITANNQNLTSNTGVNNKPCTNNTIAVRANNSSYLLTASNIPTACAGQTITVQTYGSTSAASLQQTATISGTSVTFPTPVDDAYHVSNAKVLLNGWYSNAVWAYTPVCTPYTAISLTSATSGSAPNTGNKAIDNDLNTSWIAAATDPQTITIDLGSGQDICKSTVNFGANYGTNITFQISNNGSTWNTVYNVGSNTQQTISLGDGSSTLINARWLRLITNARASTTTGVELKEWQFWAQK